MPLCHGVPAAWHSSAQRLCHAPGTGDAPGRVATYSARPDAGTVTPSIGRIVHYTNLGDRDGKYPPQIQAALITGVNADGSVALRVFYRTGDFWLEKVERTDAAAGSEDARGKWAWPTKQWT